jgi:hypothetical protein
MVLRPKSRVGSGDAQNRAAEAKANEPPGKPASGRRQDENCLLGQAASRAKAAITIPLKYQPDEQGLGVDVPEAKLDVESDE